MSKIVICKSLFFGICSFFGIAVVCFIVLLVVFAIYGDPKSVTDDPTDSRLEQGHAHYLEPAAYKNYRLVFGTLHTTCFFSGLIGLILYGIRWYMVHQGSG